MHDIVTAMVNDPHRDPRLAPLLAKLPSGIGALHSVLRWIRLQRPPHTLEPLELSLFDDVAKDIALLVDSTTDLRSILSIENGLMSFHPSPRHSATQGNHRICLFKLEFAYVV